MRKICLLHEWPILPIRERNEFNWINLHLLVKSDDLFFVSIDLFYCVVFFFCVIFTPSFYYSFSSIFCLLGFMYCIFLTVYALWFQFSIMQIEGSVDEESTKSDEEYDDLAMQDIQENGYWSDNNVSYEYSPRPLLANNESANGHHNNRDEKYKQNLARYLRSKSELTSDLHRKKVSSPGNVKVKRRSNSISISHFWKWFCSFGSWSNITVQQCGLVFLVISSSLFLITCTHFDSNPSEEPWLW